MIALTTKYQPKTMDEFHGLGRPRKIMEAFVASPYSSAWLFVGPSGLGKTSMGFAIQKALGGDLHHIPAKECDLATVQKTCMDCHFIPWSGNWHVVVVDEADQMTKPAQTAFLSVLDGTDMPPNTVFVFTANSVDKLEPRFTSRCREIPFTSDDIDFEALLRTIWDAERDRRPDPDFAGIIERAKGNIRTAITDLEIELLCTPAPPKQKRTLWFDHTGSELAWEAIEQRMAIGDFSGITTQEVFV